MAGKSLGTLTLDLVANTGGFVAGMTKAERQSAKWRKQVERDVKKVGGALAKTLTAGAGAATAAIGLLVNKSLQSVDAQAKLAQRLDTTFNSLSTLTRAGDLAGVSIDQIAVASRTLDVNLGKASQGIGAQATALEKLGLSADELASLPLDERINKINQALENNVSATERSAVAADLFGTRNAAAIQALDTGTLAEAARQAEILGLNLSDVDAAKIEMANDAMGTFGAIIDGVGQQLAVELAPALRAIGQAFLDSAEDAGGLGDSISELVGDAVEGVAFLADAADGVARVFRTLVDGYIAYSTKLLSILGNTVADVLDTLGVIPGVDFSDTVANLRDFSRLSDQISKEAAANIKDNLERPLAGQDLKEAYAKALADGQALAEQTVAGRSSGGDTATPTAPDNAPAVDKTTDAIQRQIAALREQADTFGLSAEQVDLYKLQQQGATAEQLAAVSAIYDEIEAKEAIASAEEASAERRAQALQIINDALPQQSSALEKIAQQQQFLNDSLAEFPELAEQVAEASAALDEQAAKVGETTGEMTEFSKQAARNMQSAFADFLFDPFDEGLSGMLDQFGKILLRMAAEAAAAQIFDSIGGAASGAAGGGGWIGAAASFVGGFFADGGRPPPNQISVVGERGPELFVPDGMTGTIIPNEKISMASERADRVEQTRINIGNMNFPNVQNAREAEVAAGAASRRIMSTINGAQRFG